MKKRPQPSYLANTISRQMGYEPTTIFTKGRKHEICWPRQYVQTLLHDYFKLSYAEIGACTGGFDHATAMNSVKKMHVLMTNDLEIIDLTRIWRNRIEHLLQDDFESGEPVTELPEVIFEREVSDFLIQYRNKQQRDGKQVNIAALDHVIHAFMAWNDIEIK